MKRFVYFTLLIGLLSSPAEAQDFSFDAFVGVWNGQYTSENSGGEQFPMTLEVQPNGFYTDSSGYFMPPSYYPNTQHCEFDAATNRLHFWYLNVVYAGQYFYQHFYYEVVSYTGNTLELQYNYWDDPEPHPAFGAIILHRVGTSAVGDTDLPDRTSLGANYPNPFNPSTNITFSLPQSGYVTLKVFDVRGRAVSTLVDGVLEAGPHQYHWNADGLAGGVYLYQLQTGDFTETRKMSLVK